MQIIDLDGNSYERGFRQGRQLKNDYEEMIDLFFNSDLWNENKPGPIPNSVIKFLFGVLGTTMTKKAVRKYLPYQFDRVNGIAEGLCEGNRFTWGVQFLEILFCEAGKSLKVPGGCTQVHATPKSTADGVPLSGRNYDFPNLLKDYQVVRRDVPEDSNRLATLTVTQAPLIGAHQGMNEAGLMVACNNSRQWKGKDFNYKGVPYMLLVMEILETCKNVKEASEFMVDFPLRGNAGFMGMIDESGDCCVVEFTSSRARIRRPDESGVIAQTNHFHAMKEANLPEGTYWDTPGMQGLLYATSSLKRFDAADSLLHEAAGEITIDTLKKILSDHSGNDGVGDDNTVCCHGETGSTLSSIIFDIKNRVLHVAEGNPCEGEFIEVPFRFRD